MKNKVIELIESTPTINGLKSNGEKVDLIDQYNRELFGKGIQDRKCGSCVLKAFDALRVYAGYEPLKRKESKNITKARLKICYNCEYMKPNGLLGLFDQCSICKCSIRAKAELRPKMLKLLGSCPKGFWDDI